MGGELHLTIDDNSNTMQLYHRFKSRDTGRTKLLLEIQIYPHTWQYNNETIGDLQVGQQSNPVHGELISLIMQIHPDILRHRSS